MLKNFFLRHDVTSVKMIWNALIVHKLHQKMFYNIDTQ